MVDWVWLIRLVARLCCLASSFALYLFVSELSDPRLLCAFLGSFRSCVVLSRLEGAPFWAVLKGNHTEPEGSPKNRKHKDLSPFSEASPPLPHFGKYPQKKNTHPRPPRLFWVPGEFRRFEARSSPFFCPGLRPQKVDRPVSEVAALEPEATGSAFCEAEARRKRTRGNWKGSKGQVWSRPKRFCWD